MDNPQNDPLQPGAPNPADPYLDQTPQQEGYQPFASNETPTPVAPIPSTQGPLSLNDPYQPASPSPQPSSPWQQPEPAHPSEQFKPYQVSQLPTHPQVALTPESVNPIAHIQGSYQPHQTQAPSTYPEPAAYNALQVNQPGLVPNNTDIPQKYRVFRAVGDTFRAAKNNFLTLSITVILSYVIAIVAFVLVMLAVLAAFGIGGLSAGASSKIFTAIILGLILYTTWYALAYAFVLGVSAISLYEGAEKRKTSIKATLVNGLKAIKRVAVANILVSLILWWPLVIVTGASLALTLGQRSTGGGQAGSAIIGILAGLAAMIWVIIGSLRYALVPYVAIFEPDLPITKSLSRSKHLMSKGGQWFVLKGSLLIIVIVIVLGASTGTSLQEFNSTKNLVVNFISILLTAIVNGVLVMLYRNRRAVRR